MDYYENGYRVQAFTMDEIREVLDLIEKDKTPNGNYGDDQCNLWLALGESMRKANMRKLVIDEVKNYYFHTAYDWWLRGASAVERYESDHNGVTCVSAEKLFLYFDDSCHVSEMTYDMLIDAGQKIQAIRLYTDRTGCRPSEAKEAIEKMVEERK